MIAVSDSTPLINLAKIKKIELLKVLFNKVYISPAVYKEVVINGKGRYGSQEVSSAKWISVEKVKDIFAVNLLLNTIDEGEAETIVLAKELRANYLLLDQVSARKIAYIIKSKEKLNIQIKGTLGLLVIGYRKGIIPNLKVVLDELIAKGTWIDDRIYNKVLENQNIKY